MSVGGLTIGFTAAILIGLFVEYQNSWNLHNEFYEDIVFVKRQNTKSVDSYMTDNTSPHCPVITALKLEEFPEFRNVTLVHEEYDNYVSRPGSTELFRTERGFYVDSNYTDVFTVDFVSTPEPGYLNNPGSVLLSETLAEKVFGSTDVIGNNIVLNKKDNLRITGVYKDLPPNTTFRPEYIISFSTLEKELGISRNDIWTIGCRVYGRLEPHADFKSLNPKVKDVLKAHEELENEELSLVPLAGLQRYYMPDYFVIVWIFTIIGVFILCMSVFNYINLSIVRAVSRTKEVAVKKLSGGEQRSIVGQFLGESFFLAFLAMLIAIVLSVAILPLFNNIMEVELSNEFYLQPHVVFILFGLTVATGILAGIYPAFFITSKNIPTLVKSNLLSGAGNKLNLRKTLVTAQFVITCFLLSLTIYFFVQIRDISGKDVGFDRHNLIFSEISHSGDTVNFDNLRKRILRHPEISNASMSENFPFVKAFENTTNWEGSAPEEVVWYHPNRVTYDYVSTLGLQVIEGRDFSLEYPSDEGKACLINETALEVFGWDNPIGKHLNNNEWRVIGVVKDYHLSDIHNIIKPAVLVLSDEDLKGKKILSFRYVEGNGENAREIISDELKKQFPESPFSVSFHENAFSNEVAFRAYMSLYQSLIFFLIFTIVLVVVGLWALVTFTTQKRTKEIGIRKINGCSVWGLFYLLNKEYFILSSAAILIALPFVLMVYGHFPGAYKLPFYPWIVLLSAAVIFTITFFTSGFVTFRAASQNPVDTLRSE
jgi:putative ABC transport system permease protein